MADQLDFAVQDGDALEVNELNSIINHINLPDYIPENNLTPNARAYFTEDYREVNQKLRSGEELSASGEEMRDSVLSFMKPLSKGVTVFRGVGGSIPEKAKRIPCGSFLSASTAEPVAKSFFDRRMEQQGSASFLHISAPKGTVALVSNEDECEVVFPPEKYALEITKRTRSTVFCKLVSK